MKVKTLFMSLLLVLGAILLNAQVEPVGQDIKDTKKSCVSFAQIKQECQDDNTVDLTFLISNNTLCNTTGVSITPVGGVGQSYPINIGPLTVSNVPITHTGATPGTTLCFDVVLHGGERGGRCCTERVCIEIDCCNSPGCCDDLEAEILSTDGCGPDGSAVIRVTGGTPSYTSQPAATTSPVSGIFIYNGLSAGTNTILYTDSEGCEVEIDIEIPENDLEVIFEESGGCDPINQWAKFTITGGSGQYTYTGPHNYNQWVSGTIFVFGLTVGTHTLIFEDSQGCQVAITVTIPSSNCDQFKYIYINPNNPTFEITSEISATLNLSIVGWCIPDMVSVFVNDTLIFELIAGESDCNGTLDIDVGDSESFCVSPCDEIRIETMGNVCPDQHGCSSDTTWYDVTINSCTLKNDGGNNFTDFEHSTSRSNVNKELALHQEKMIVKAQQSIEVFPNPVTDKLNIMNTDPKMKYQSARIINSAGQVVHTENMSNLDQIQIDANPFPGGIYLIEITSTKGNKIVEKFLKLN